MYVLIVEMEKENGNSRKTNLNSLVNEALRKGKHVLEMMKPWQTLLNEAPNNKGGKEEKRDET